MSNAQSMQVYSRLSRIKQALATSPKYKLGGGNKHIVDIDEIENLLGDLDMTIPEEIRKAQGIIKQSEQILADAREEAEEIIAKAREEAEELGNQAQEAAEKVYNQAVDEYNALVAQDSVYQEAVRRAELIETEANDNANSIVGGARRYADDQLADVQRYLNNCIRTLNANREELNVEPLPDNEPDLTVKQRAEKLEMKHPEKQSAEPKRRVSRPVAYEEPEEDLDEVSSRKEDIEEEDEAPVAKPKKKSWFKRLLEGDDDENEDDAEDKDLDDIPEDEDEPEEKPKKQRRKIFKLVDTDEDEESLEDEE